MLDVIEVAETVLTWLDLGRKFWWIRILLAGGPLAITAMPPCFASGDVITRKAAVVRIH